MNDRGSAQLICRFCRSTRPQLTKAVLAVSRRSQNRAELLRPGPIIRRKASAADIAVPRATPPFPLPALCARSVRVRRLALRLERARNASPASWQDFDHDEDHPAESNPPLPDRSRRCRFYPTCWIDHLLKKREECPGSSRRAVAWREEVIRCGLRGLAVGLTQIEVVEVRGGAGGGEVDGRLCAPRRRTRRG